MASQPPPAPPLVSTPPSPPAPLLPDAPAYTLANVFASVSSVSSPASLLASAPSSLAASPCLRPALQWGACVALLLALHRARRIGALLAPRVAGDAALGWLGTVSLQWFLCRRDEHDKRLALRAFYAARAQGGGGGGGGQLS